MAIALVAQYATSFTSFAAPQTVSPTVGVGDFLVVCATSSNSNDTSGAPSGGGLTYTLAAKNENNASFTPPNAYIWTAPSLSAQSFTLSLSAGGSDWGFAAYRFSGVSSIGNSITGIDSGSGSAPSVSLTTAVVNAAIVMINGDTDANAGAATYRTASAGTFTENTHVVDGTTMTTWGGFYANAGSAGAKTIGLSAPATQAWSLIAVELRPVLALPGKPLIVNKALRRSTNY